MCPFLNTSDDRCADHLTLENIECALEHCAGEYENCPIYCERKANAHRHDQAKRAARLAIAG